MLLVGMKTELNVTGEYWVKQATRVYMCDTAPMTPTARRHLFIALLESPRADERDLSVIQTMLM